MIYHVIGITLMPGKRFEGVEHMKKFAGHMKEAYGVSSEVLGNETGMVYRHFMVSRYESLAQYEETNAKVFDDPKYLEWFTEGKDAGYYDWSSADTQLFRTY